MRRQSYEKKMLNKSYLPKTYLKLCLLEFLECFVDFYNKNGLLDSEGEGEGGMIWENGILTCILSCKN